MLKRSLGLQPTHPTPSWNASPLFDQLVFEFGKSNSWEGIRSCIRWPRISLGWPIGDGSGSGRPVKGYDITSLPYCRYTGIVLLEEKIVSNSVIDLQDT